MKSKSRELLDRSLAAAISSIEVFNKPDFLYREESFAILLINAWELLIKAKWLALHKNETRSLYIYTSIKKKDGTASKKLKHKTTRSGNPLTHSIDYVAQKLVESNDLDPTVWKNIQALLEIRDSAIHFYNYSGAFSLRLQEIGAASIQNYTHTAKIWFQVDFSKYNLYIMPISFILNKKLKTIVLNHEEKNFIAFVNSFDAGPSETTPFSVSLNIDINFTRSKAIDAIPWRHDSSPNAIPVKFSEEQLSQKYPLSYNDIFHRCKQQYINFKKDTYFHEIMRQLKNDKKYCYLRELHPGNPKSPKKHFYSEAIFSELNKYYSTVKQ